jgi:hemoglobin
MSSLYERLGGEAAVDAAVDKFYDKVLADDRIKHFFDGVDMVRQRGHQKLFLTYAFGGAPSYPGRAMRVAHQRLVADQGLSDEHFDAVLDDLANTLKELGIPDELVSEAAEIAESTRNDVLNR